MAMRSLFRPFAVSLMKVNHAPLFISSSLRWFHIFFCIRLG